MRISYNWLKNYIDINLPPEKLAGIFTMAGIGVESVEKTADDSIFELEITANARGDSRLIPGGWLIRASGLDELPQIINVLRGEMSLIGPRPCVPYEYEKYLPWQRERFNAVPGLSGLWQVSGKNRTTFEEMIRLDILYSRTVSFWLDLKIVFLTIPALLVQISDTVRGKKSVAQLKPPTATSGAETTGQRQTT